MKLSIILAMTLLLWVPVGFAADHESKDDANHDSGPKALDGVNIEAVENYPNTSNHELGFGLGFFPFKPYYYGFSFNGDYIYYFNKSIAWEILNVGYTLTSNTNLTTQLADKYGVAPQTIERLSAVFSSNLMYVFTHGKLLLFDHFIDHFRASVLAGGGLVMTNLSSQAASSLGVRVDGFINDTLSWKIEFRNMVTLSSLDDYVAINLGIGVTF